MQKPTLDENKKEEEDDRLFALFLSLLLCLENKKDEWDALEKLMDERAKIGIEYALEGYGVTIEDAIELLKEKNEDVLTDNQLKDRNIILAAIDNIVDFSVVEEYQMATQIPKFDELFDEDDVELVDIDDMGEYLQSLFERFNMNYVGTENLDIKYSMMIASVLSTVKDGTILTYMTQGDNRVRPWHMQYEGYSAPRSLFPSWLIPPIEHGCRCYLVEDSITASINDNVFGKSKKEPEIPSWFNKTFKESVANCGRIFSDEHPYFNVKEEHYERLQEISDRIKKKYLNVS